MKSNFVLINKNDDVFEWLLNSWLQGGCDLLTTKHFFNLFNNIFVENATYSVPKNKAHSEYCYPAWKLVYYIYVVIKFMSETKNPNEKLLNR